MSALKTVVAAAVLLALPIVSAEGLSITNSCPFNVYYKVTTDSDSAIQTVASGATSTMPYTSKSDGGGPSVKVSSSPAVSGDILQMEYTMAGSMLFYDISNIDGLPFGNHNVGLSTNKNCPAVTCTAGQFPCSDAYNVPDDNQATKACPLSGTDTILTLCSDNSGGASGSGVGAVAGSVASAVNSVVQAAAPAPSQAQPQAPAPDTNANVAAAPTTLSTSVVAAAATPAPQAAAPAAAPAAAAPAPAASASSDSADDDFSALHFPASWGASFSSNAENFDDSENLTKPKRSMRIHRHHAHLAAHDSS